MNHGGVQITKMTKQFQHDCIFEGCYVLLFFKVKELHLGIKVLAVSSVDETLEISLS